MQSNQARIYYHFQMLECEEKIQFAKKNCVGKTLWFSIFAIAIFFAKSNYLLQLEF